MAERVLAVSADHLRIVCDILQRLIPHCQVWAFGSRVTGTHKDYSDLDLAIITDAPLDITTSANVSDAFSQSDLPYKVDVVEWATTSETFRKIIQQNKIIVQAGQSASTH